MVDVPVTELAEPVGESDHARGAADAPVTLVEYADFECLHCGRAYPILRQIQEEMGDTLRVVFRHFPLGWEHPHAQHAAEAAEAAGAQGRFWEMHDQLFEHQRALDDEALAGYAQTIGLDVPRFWAELRSHSHVDRVRRDVESGRRSGVRGTPTFFLNEMRYGDAFDLDALRAALEDAARQSQRG